MEENSVSITLFLDRSNTVSIHFLKFLIILHSSASQNNPVTVAD